MAHWLVCTLLFLWLAPAQAQPAAPLHLLDQALITRSLADAPPPLGVGVPVALPDHWYDSSAALPDQRWYSLRFDDDGWALPAIYIERACTHLEVWLNGERVAAGGSMVEPLTRSCYFPQLIRLARSQLRANGNQLDIRVVGYPQAYVTARQRTGGLSAVLVGEQAQLVPRFETRVFWNITVAQVIGLCMLLFGLVIAALGWVRRQDRHYRYFGMVLVLWAVMGLRLYVQHWPLAALASELLWCALFAPYVYAVLQFLLHYIGQPRRWAQQLLLWQCALTPLLLLLAPAPLLGAAASTLYLLWAAEFVLTMGFVLVHSWRVRRGALWLMSASLLLVLALVVAEIAVQTGLLALPPIHLIHFVMPVIFLAIGLHLVQQFARALGESERLNRELEQRVTDKTAQIERSYAQLSDLRAEQSAAAERQRIASDLHDDLGAQLVTIAQASLFSDDVGRVAGLARQALDDMRLAVRGLTAEPTPLPYLLADWRAETVERLTLAGVAVCWQASDCPLHWMLPARVQVQFARILREATSNVIRHSGARTCWIDLHVSPEHLQLGIEDDGCGFDATLQASGQGLGNMQRRARALDAALEISPRPGAGVRLRLCVPLALTAGDSSTHSGDRSG